MSEYVTKYYPLWFAPDLDSSWNINPGIVKDLVNYVPSKRNTLKTYQCSTTESIGHGFQGLGAVPNSGNYLYGGIYKKIDGSARLLLGCDLGISELSVGGYTLVKTWSATASAVCFTTFGNDVIAVSKNNPVQISSISAFADLGGGPPKASCCTTNKNFVMLGDCNDGTNDLGDQVWWCALGNDASWTVSAATEAGNYRLLDTPGKVTALVNMRDTVIAYKEDSIYIGDYQGTPLLWTWRLVTDKAGCASPHGVAVVDGIHYFLHRTGVKRFDGASVQDIGAPVNRYLFDKMVTQSRYATVHAGFDEYESVIYWLFNTTASVNDRNQALTYNTVTGKFAFITTMWRASSSGGDAGSCHGIVSATLSDISAWNSSLGSYTSNILTAGLDNSAGLGEIRKPKVGDTGPGTGHLDITTGDIGDEVSITTIKRVIPRMFSVSPSFWNNVNSLTVAHKPSFSASYSAAVSTFSADTTNRRWDGMGNGGKLLQISIPVFDYGEIAGLYVTMKQSGTE